MKKLGLLVVIAAAVGCPKPGADPAVVPDHVSFQVEGMRRVNGAL
jgi:hypothetical protein